MNKTILLNNRPVGKPKESDFKFIDEKKPEIDHGEILLKTKYVSVDPYLRGRMNDAKSYTASFELNKPISSGIIAEVIETKNKNYTTGEFVSGLLEWREYQNSDGSNLQKVDAEKAPLSAYLGILGMTGLTAYIGLTEIGKPEKGETLVVSGAAGAVGSVVGQIGKLLGCRVIGIAGTDEKISLLKNKFSFDEAVNYNSADLSGEIKKACPDGVDVYFDNVGGEISDAVHQLINNFARIIICGAISLYNETSPPVGPRIQPILLKNKALMKGFIIGDYAQLFPEASQQLSKWLKEEKLAHQETIVKGFDNIPQAFMDLFVGKNKGKMIVEV